MKVLFVPDGTQGNPYQKELAKNLKKYSVNVILSNGIGKMPILGILKTFGKPDLLHLHWTHGFMLGNSPTKTIIKSFRFLIELSIVKLLRVKIVWTIHNIVSHERTFKSLELFFNKFLAKICNAIIVHGSFAKREIIKVYKAKESLIKVVPHGNYINYYPNVISKAQAKNKLQLKAEEVVFLYFGQIRPYKGIPELIDAFKKLNHPQTRLLIVGNPLNNEIADEIQKKCGGDKNIKLVFEFVTDNEIQIYMNAADVIVLPYKDILTSGSVMLAMSFGKPIIAPTIGCVPDVLDIEGSFLYNALEKDGLVNAMRRVFNSDIIKMGNHNFELAKHFEWDKIAKKTYEIYCECLKKKNKKLAK